MRRVMLALALGVLASLALAPGAEARRVLIAFVPKQPAPKMPLLFDFEQRNFAFGVTSTTIGAFSKRQFLLDVSQGTRISNTAYKDPTERLDLVYRRGRGHMAGWRKARERAERNREQDSTHSAHSM